MFQGGGFCDGTGQNPDMVLGSSKAGQEFLGPSMGVAEARKRNWLTGAQMTHTDAQTEKWFKQIRTWKKAFEGRAVPLTMPVSANNQGTELFIFIPPYCS
jgi:hypothetical protein